MCFQGSVNYTELGFKHSEYFLISHLFKGLWPVSKLLVHECYNSATTFKSLDLAFFFFRKLKHKITLGPISHFCITIFELAPYIHKLMLFEYMS